MPREEMLHRIRYSDSELILGLRGYGFVTPNVNTTGGTKFVQINEDSPNWIREIYSLGVDLDYLCMDKAFNLYGYRLLDDTGSIFKFSPDIDDYNIYKEVDSYDVTYRPTRYDLKIDPDGVRFWYVSTGEGEPGEDGSLILIDPTTWSETRYPYSFGGRGLDEIEGPSPDGQYVYCSMEDDKFLIRFNVSGSTFETKSIEYPGSGSGPAGGTVDSNGVPWFDDRFTSLIKGYESPYIFPTGTTYSSTDTHPSSNPDGSKSYFSKGYGSVSEIDSDTNQITVYSSTPSGSPVGKQQNNVQYLSLLDGTEIIVQSGMPWDISEDICYWKVGEPTLQHNAYYGGSSPYAAFFSGTEGWIKYGWTITGSIPYPPTSSI